MVIEVNPGTAANLNEAIVLRFDAHPNTSVFTDADKTKLDVSIDAPVARDTLATMITTGTHQRIVFTRVGDSINAVVDEISGGFTEAEIKDIVGAMIPDAVGDGLTVTYDNAGKLLSIFINDGAMFRRSPWDASAGVFPSGGQNGYRYKVSVGGTVGGQPFVAEDVLICIADNASTTVFAGNWERVPIGEAIDKARTAVQPGALLPVYTQLSASRNTTSADNGADVECTANATMTILADLTPKGLIITCREGVASVAPGAGVTFEKETDLQLVANSDRGFITVKPTSVANAFYISGSLASV